jgi:hypothetical protein
VDWAWTKGQGKGAAFAAAFHETTAGVWLDQRTLPKPSPIFCRRTFGYFVRAVLGAPTPLVCVSQDGRGGPILCGDSLLGSGDHRRQRFLNFFSLPSILYARVFSSTTNRRSVRLGNPKRGLPYGKGSVRFVTR